MLAATIKAMQRAIGLNNKIEWTEMKVNTKKNQYSFATLSLLVLLFANSVKAEEQSTMFYEVEIKSIQFWQNTSASVVAEYCDENEQCKNIMGRVDDKTVMMKAGEKISFRQARKLNWTAAIMSVDKFDRVISLDYFDPPDTVDPKKI